jgi:trehalose-6-phosphate synthase
MDCMRAQLFFCLERCILLAVNIKGGSVKINYTLFFSIVLATGIVAVGFTFFQVTGARQRMNSILAERSAAIADELEIAAREFELTRDTLVFDSVATRLCKKYRLPGVAVFEDVDRLVYSNITLTKLISNAHSDVLLAITSDSVLSHFTSINGLYIHSFIRPVNESATASKAIVIFTDAGYVRQEVLNIWLRNIMRWLIQAFLVASITILIIRWSIFTPLNYMVRWMKSARIGSDEQLKKAIPFRFLGALHTEATRLTEAMTEARAIAEEEVKLRTYSEAVWTPLRLNAEAKLILRDRKLVVVSNREPYMHVQDGRDIKCIIPASGMVTAMEPILEACGGLWVATGSGNADKKVVDSSGKIAVPPEDPKYTLRRVWTTQEEEEHFYYGFSNEGLWPLCHAAHTRPVFRDLDWHHYKAVNKKFAAVVLGEIKSAEKPFILVQDYHFSLLPAMIKETRPDARISIFWHIPWPNPESFGICPWRNEILTGILGADLVGFHTQYHCNNFLSTVNRTLEARVAYETFSITMGNHTTRVRPFPISIAFTTKDDEQEGEPVVPAQEILKKYNIQGQILGIGVDRVDYTKGIIERFHAVERFLEKNLSYTGQLTFVQIGAPSRTFIKNYADILDRVREEAERINRKFQSQNWKPILLLDRHHSHEEIKPFYNAASFCMVTSLHDGMNLVAKEFVVSRNDRRGSLILSRFTGAAQELTGALIVNPYDIEEMADAIHTALIMPEAEQQMRMTQMRQIILRHNIYSWAADLLNGMNAE